MRKFRLRQAEYPHVGLAMKESFTRDKADFLTHEREFGGKVFYIYSTKVNGKKVIMNPDVIEIRKEIDRLEK